MKHRIKTIVLYALPYVLGFLGCFSEKSNWTMIQHCLHRFNLNLLHGLNL